MFYPDNLLFFANSSELQVWLAQYHTQKNELWLGYYKKNSGIASINWSQSVDEALCFGWIDGLRKTIDAQRYAIRFTPRKPNSIWSAVNIAKVAQLTEAGLMQPAGIAAFEKRTHNKSKVYSFEQENIQLTPEYEDIFRQNEPAWHFFQAQTPSYRKPAMWWVISAKQTATRLKRLHTLIQDSENGQKVAHLRR